MNKKIDIIEVMDSPEEDCNEDFSVCRTSADDLVVKDEMNVKVAPKRTSLQEVMGDSTDV